MSREITVSVTAGFPFMKTRVSAHGTTRRGRHFFKVVELSHKKTKKLMDWVMGHREDTVLDEIYAGEGFLTVTVVVQLTDP